MGVDLVLRIFIYTIVSKLCAGTSGTISHFRVLRKHRHIKECAAFIMSDKNGYIGGRVSEKTGECEGLPYSWDWNQSIEAEYGYFRQISTTQKSFVPPIDVREDGYSLAIPGTFDTGARLELYVTMFEENTHNINVTITEVSNSHRGFQLLLDSRGNRIYFNELPDELNGDDDLIIGFPDSFHQTTNQILISFVAKKSSIEVLVDEQTVVTKESKNVRLDLLTHFAVSSTHPNALFLHRFQFR